MNPMANMEGTNRKYTSTSVNTFDVEWNSFRA
jgi:hypothetical protein